MADNIKKLKDKEIGIDESKKFQESIDKIASEYIKTIDDALKSKEEDLKKNIVTSKKSSFLKRKSNHIAIIMDGNGRWASKKKYTKKTGHKAGIENCIKLCESLDKLKYQIDEISFLFSENWKSSYEVKNLFELIHIPCSIQ